MRSLVVLSLLLVLALPAFSQSNYAVISGTVTDSQHLPVAGLGLARDPAMLRSVRGACVELVRADSGFVAVHALTIARTGPAA